jgi:phospholipase C
MSTLPAGIDHIVVLMLENRSFDHLLGSLPNVEGPTGHSNVDPGDGSVVAVTFDAAYTSPALPDPVHRGQMAGDPHHDFISVNRQLFETDTPGPTAPITCGGFIAAGRKSGDPDAERIAREVMKCFDTPKQLTTMAALAADFVVCDHWYSSVPGPTWPNRLFVHAATSGGALDNNLRFYDLPTIYDLLDKAAVDWAIYYHDTPQSACLHELLDRRDRQHRRCMRPVTEFFREVNAHRSADPTRRTLPGYVFIEPAYLEPSHTVLGWIADVFKWLAHLIGLPVQPSRSHANDQHAPHDVRFGEHLIADVYDALRSNDDVWQHCLFIVLHDEHGGLYDHQPPPAATPPDTRGSEGPPFGFNRAGLRVPALLISPYLRSAVEHTPYDHTSIVRTVREHFCPAAEPLTPRDRDATALQQGLFSSTPRANTPRRLTRPRPVFAIPSSGDPAGRPLNDLQANLVHLAAAVAARATGAPRTASIAPPAPASDPTAALRPTRSGGALDLTGVPKPGAKTEAEGYAFVRDAMQQHERR